MDFEIFTMLPMWVLVHPKDTCVGSHKNSRIQHLKVKVVLGCVTSQRQEMRAPRKPHTFPKGSPILMGHGKFLVLHAWASIQSKLI
jgi:hypothetical protein